MVDSSQPWWIQIFFSCCICWSTSTREVVQENKPRRLRKTTQLPDGCYKNRRHTWLCLARTEVELKGNYCCNNRIWHQVQDWQT